MKRDPMNDDLYDSNDEQIEDLKELILNLRNAARNLVSKYERAGYGVGEEVEALEAALAGGNVEATAKDFKLAVVWGERAEQLVVYEYATKAEVDAVIAILDEANGWNDWQYESLIGDQKPTIEAAQSELEG